MNRCWTIGLAVARLLCVLNQSCSVEGAKSDWLTLSAQHEHGDRCEQAAWRLWEAHQKTLEQSMGIQTVTPIVEELAHLCREQAAATSSKFFVLFNVEEPGCYGTALETPSTDPVAEVECLDDLGRSRHTGYQTWTYGEFWLNEDNTIPLSDEEELAHRRFVLFALESMRASIVYNAVLDWFPESYTIDAVLQYTQQRLRDPDVQFSRLAPRSAEFASVTLVNQRITEFTLSEHFFYLWAHKPAVAYEGLAHEAAHIIDSEVLELLRQMSPYIPNAHRRYPRIADAEELADRVALTFVAHSEVETSDYGLRELAQSVAAGSIAQPIWDAAFMQGGKSYPQLRELQGHAERFAGITSRVQLSDAILAFRQYLTEQMMRIQEFSVRAEQASQQDLDELEATLLTIGVYGPTVLRWGLVRASQIETSVQTRSRMFEFTSRFLNQLIELGDALIKQYDPDERAPYPQDFALWLQTSHNLSPQQAEQTIARLRSFQDPAAH